MSTTYCFSLPRLTCCSLDSVNKDLDNCFANCKKTLPVIEGFVVNLVEKKLTVTIEDVEYQPEVVRQFLREAVNHEGMECLDLELSDESGWIKKTLRSHWFQGFIGTGSGIALLVLSLFAATLPLTAMVAIAITSTALTLVLGVKSYQEAAKTLIKSRTLTMDTLFAISTATVLIVSAASFFIPWLPKMYDAGLLIFGFRHVGQAIEDSIKKNMGLGVRFKDRAPADVRVFVTEDMIAITPLNAIKAGEVIEIEAGQVIPVDGICEVDEGWVFDTIVTGATLPRRVVRGEALLAGMYTPDDAPRLKVRVTASAKDSYLARLDNHMMNANLNKAPLETETKRYLQYFIPIVIMAAVLSGLIISQFFPFAIAIQCAVSVLVSACPCTLGFITPLAVKIGMTKAAEHGVQFKSAEKLQAGAQITGVVFDLNGTFTTGVPVVRQYGVTTDARFSARDLLACFALMEKNSDHLVAKAICEFVRKQRIEPDIAWQLRKPDSSNHFGLSAEINNQPFTVGNQTMMALKGINVTALQNSVKPAEGDSVIYLARENKVVGYIILTDPLRENARHAVDSLKKLGKEVFICTGADEVTALRYAKRLGIPPANVAAACVGHQKGLYIQKLQDSGYRVAMVGDAANDAVAVNGSTFSLAIKSNGGDEVTQQAAGAVISNGSLLPVVSAFAIAQQTVDNIKQNLFLSLGYNIAAMLVAGGLLLSVGVSLNPGVGVALMIVQSSLILLNAYRFKQQGLNHLHQPSESVLESDSYGLLHANMPGKRSGDSLNAADREEKGCSNQVFFAHPRHSEQSEGSPSGGLVLNAGDPSLCSG